ncbi:MAG TPA: ATP-binding protein [Caldilineaceae bacterium]|nr:ATP-binding protein [Caldilineaceae bacterium]
MQPYLSHLFSRLWFRLMGAFVLIISLVILVTVILTRQGTDTQFAHFMVNGQMIRTSRLVQNLAAFYQRQQSWTELDAQLDQVLLEASDGTMNSMFQGMMGMYNNRMQVVDAEGRLVADTEEDTGSPLSAVQRWPIFVDEAEVGSLVVEGAMMGHTMLDGDILLRGVTRAAIVAGSIAGIVALLMAGLLVRQITRPVAGLVQASRNIADGDLTTRVAIRSNDELGELAKTFNQMASSLERQERVRRALIADVAHELRTPLTGIQGTIEAFQDGVFAPTAENFAIIHKEILLLNRLIEDLRTLANADAGTLPLHFAPVDLAALAQQQVAAFQYQAREQQIDLQVTIDHPLTPISGDEERLGQIFINLLDNALRHTPVGGAIQLSLVNATDGVEIRVRDSGAGIPPAALPHIFERFYRVDPARNRETGGSGLGLTITRQLVEGHGGRIRVNSPPPVTTKGSEFCLFLPAVPTEEGL